eukprot:GHVU01108837.1.p1 GENE.GHVU01108837.1~~GHVU01108837.1.p1  ORF type:complete len:186 (+),score=34.68 GHVU01108837.1:40-558(+)
MAYLPQRSEIKEKTLKLQNEEFVVRLMKKSDYAAARKLIPKVSSCEIELAEDAVAQITALNTYFPFVVIDSSGEIIGFAELYCLPHLGRRCDARLERVVVDETHRGKGIASALCVHILQLAEGVLHCGRVDLTVEKDNARHIYEDKLGFEQIQTTVMRKKFGAASAASPSHK